MPEKCCEKCGASLCPYCERADCNGDKECLQAKVNRLEQRVKELEHQVRPIITVTPSPYPVYIPYVPQPVWPTWAFPITCGDTLPLTSSGHGCVSNGIDLPADGSTHTVYLS